MNGIKCVSCGKPQGYKKNTLNWKKHTMCCECARRKHWQDYAVMKCKKCNNTSNHITAKCWKKYGLCRDCVKKEHPEEYPNKEFKPSYYKICPKCFNIMQKLFYTKLHVFGKNTNLYVCTECVCIYNMGTRFNIVKMSDLIKQTLISN